MIIHVKKLQWHTVHKDEDTELHTAPFMVLATPSGASQAFTYRVYRVSPSVPVLIATINGYEIGRAPSFAECVALCDQHNTQFIASWIEGIQA